MRAAYVPAPGRIEVADFDVIRPVEGEVLVRMHRASICGSDLHVVYHGFHHPEAFGRPGYPGHEGVGEIVESHSKRFSEGQKVLTIPVGNWGGCFAEYQAIDDLHLLPLPKGDERRLMMAQQLGTTMFAMRRFWRSGSVEGQGKVAAVMGAGSAGLFFLQQIVQLGFDTVVVSDLNAERLDVARRLGADVIVQAPTESLSEAVLDVTGGLGADLVVEAVGSDALRAEAITAVTPGGVVGYYGFPERYGMAPFPAFDAFRKAAIVEWVSGAQAEPGLSSFAAALTAISSGAIEVDYCLEVEFPLEAVPEAVALAEEQGRGAVKIGITIADDVADS